MFKKISLKSIADDKTVLGNPHKGWYWHYYDNGMLRPIYRDKTPIHEDYHSFPGLNHLYLRIDWADIQPEPDVFNWDKIYSVIDEWSKKGYTFSFRICCNETWPIQCFAAPEWLYDMGCGGGFYKRGDKGGVPTDKNGGGTWEPDYADPIFLKYLEKLIQEFAARFDGDPRIEYIDIGSYGNWGEGHTYFGSKRSFGLETLTTHALLHAKYIKKTPVLVNDDFIMQMYGAPESDKLRLQGLCMSLGFGIRDDSVLVGSWDYRKYHNVENPELFRAFSENAPSNIELAHYSHYTRDQAKAGLRIIEAARECRATFMGFHGYPDEWLKDNYYVTEYLANRLGYWYFINSIAIDEYAYPGCMTLTEIEWENCGFAPCYTKFLLELKYSSAETNNEYIFAVPEFDNRKFLEGHKYCERYFLRLPDDISAGKYIVSLRLTDTSDERRVLLAIKKEQMDKDGFYALAEICVRKD